MIVAAFGAFLRLLALVATLALSPLLLAAADYPDELGCSGEWANSPLCVERARAFDARAKIEAILPLLDKVPRPPWVLADHAAASALYQEGLALFRDEYFGDAAAKFEPALDGLQEIQRQYTDLVAATVAEAEISLAKEDFAAALVGFRTVLVAWEPDHPEALAGAATAETGQRLVGIATEATKLVHGGEHDRARAILDGITADFRPTAVDRARQALRDYERRGRLNALITLGHAALDDLDPEGAAQVFRDALVIDPESNAARDGLVEARRRVDGNTLASLRRNLATQLKLESWDAAVGSIRQIAKLEPAADEVRIRLPELVRLVELEDHLDRALADPERATAKSMRDDTRTLVSSAQDPEHVGERIHAKSRQLRRQLAQWTTPVALTITSDNRTEILIRPGRKLGRFRMVDLEVYPGRYILVARRTGFREKRVELAVPPDSQPIALELVCDERF